MLFAMECRQEDVLFVQMETDDEKAADVERDPDFVREAPQPLHAHERDRPQHGGAERSQIYLDLLQHYSGVAPSVPVANASMAAADKAVLYASVDAFRACRSWLFANVRSVMEPTPL